MMSFNLVVLAGNAGRDPETKELEGTTVTSFRLAIDTYKGKDASGKAKEEMMWGTSERLGKAGCVCCHIGQKGHTSACFR